MNRYIWVVITLSSMLMVGVNAESLKEKKARKDALESVQKDTVDHVNEFCGTGIKLEMDWKSFEKAYTGGYTAGSAASYCGSIFEGIKNICETMGDDGKASVKKSIKTVKCSYKKGVSTKDFAKQLDLKSGTLTAQYDWNTANIADGAKEYLGGKLE